MLPEDCLQRATQALTEKDALETCNAMSEFVELLNAGVFISNAQLDRGHKLAMQGLVLAIQQKREQK